MARIEFYSGKCLDCDMDEDYCICAEHPVQVRTPEQQAALEAWLNNAAHLSSL